MVKVTVVARVYFFFFFGQWLYFMKYFFWVIYVHLFVYYIIIISWCGSEIFGKDSEVSRGWFYLGWKKQTRKKESLLNKLKKLNKINLLLEIVNVWKL